MPFIDNLQNLINQKQINKNKLLKDLHLGKNSIINWETRKNIPNGETLLKLSEYFNVSIDYLLDNPIKEPTPVQDAYDKASEDIQCAVRKLLDL